MRPQDITPAMCEAVENRVGMGCNAWDCVPAAEIIAASVDVAGAELLAALKDCAESMRVFLVLNKLKPEENETYAAAVAAIAKAEARP